MTMVRLHACIHVYSDSIDLSEFKKENLIFADLSFGTVFFLLCNTEIISDPSYPGQWRVSGEYIEQIARMTHWEYPEAVARFGRQLDAVGIAQELQHRGAETGDLVMVDEYDFEFNPNLTNMYIPQELLEREERQGKPVKEEEDEAVPWRPFPQGGFLDVDTDELVGFSESEDWDLLDDDWDDDDDFEFSEDEVWTA
jgi:Obg family GTPase CgtA-like protein